MVKDYIQFYTFNDFFSDEEIKKIKHHAISLPIEPGKTLGQVGRLVSEQDISITLRECEVKWLHINPEISWLFTKIHKCVTSVNESFFHYDLNSAEPLQYTVYHSPGGTFGQHIDMAPDKGLHRKLSFSIQLSDPTEYQGGDVLIYCHSLEHSITANKNKGSITIFPSFTIHEVKPVINGMREALVGWFSGPPFK